MNNRRGAAQKPSSRVSKLFSWWSQEYGSDDNLAQLLEVPRQTVWRWRTGVIQNLRPGDRREVARMLRINLETLREFLDGEITLECLESRRGERSVPLEELLTEIQGRPTHELVTLNLHLANLLAEATREVSGVMSQSLKKNLPETTIPDTLNKQNTDDTAVIHLETFREARRLRNLIKAAQDRMGLSRRQYLDLVSKGDEQALEIATLLYADVMDETLRSHTERTYQLFCPHLFRLVEWQGPEKDEPRVNYTQTYPDVKTLLSDLKNSTPNMAIR